MAIFALAGLGNTVEQLSPDQASQMIAQTIASECAKGVPVEQAVYASMGAPMQAMSFLETANEATQKIYGDAIQKGMADGIAACGGRTKSTAPAGTVSTSQPVVVGRDGRPIGTGVALARPASMSTYRQVPGSIRGGLTLAPVVPRLPSSMSNFRVPPPPPVDVSPPSGGSTKTILVIGLGLLVVGAVVYSQKDKMTANRRRGRKHRRSRRSRRGYGRRSRRR